MNKFKFKIYNYTIINTIYSKYYIYSDVAKTIFKVCASTKIGRWVVCGLWAIEDVLL